MQVLFEYKVKVTAPVGATPPESEAVSLTGVIATPSVPVCGLAAVLIVGDALPTAICSLVPPQPVAMPVLLVSPG